LGLILLVFRDDIELFEINFDKSHIIGFLNPTSKFIRFITNSIICQYEMMYTGNLNLTKSVMKKALENLEIDGCCFTIHLDFTQRKVS